MPCAGLAGVTTCAHFFHLFTLFVMSHPQQQVQPDTAAQCAANYILSPSIGQEIISQIKTPYIPDPDNYDRELYLTDLRDLFAHVEEFTTLNAEDMQEFAMRALSAIQKGAPDYLPRALDQAGALVKLVSNLLYHRNFILHHFGEVDTLLEKEGCDE